MLIIDNNWYCTAFWIEHLFGVWENPRGALAAAPAVGQVQVFCVRFAQLGNSEGSDIFSQVTFLELSERDRTTIASTFWEASKRFQTILQENTLSIYKYTSNMYSIRVWRSRRSQGFVQRGLGPWVALVLGIGQVFFHLKGVFSWSQLIWLSHDGLGASWDIPVAFICDQA